MDATVIAITLVALLIGAALGWLWAGRESAGAKQTAENLRLQLDEVVKERDANREAATKLAALEASQLERERGFEGRIKELVEAKEALSAQFSEISNKLLAEAQETFLKRADQRFRQSEEHAGQNLKALLQPVHERLERYETTVQKVEAERRDAFGMLSGQIEAMRTGTERVSAEAAKLVNALRNAPKARGRWGEQQLRNVLESCGLSEHCDFATEVSVMDGEGARLRPDVVVRVPGGQSLVIDAKVSLNEYQDAFGAVDETARETHLIAHANAIRAHVNMLGAKAYWTQFDDAPDYVVMFIPGEHFLDRRPRAGSDALGLRVRQARAPGDTDEPHRDRSDRCRGLEAGAPRQGGTADRRTRQGALRAAREGRRRSAQGRQRTVDCCKQLQ